MLDLHLQYALHTTSFEEQPLSDKTLSRFRKRCYDYEMLHNVDLYHDCVKNLSSTIAKIMGINGRVRRMDSMMIESNIRKLSRMELLYTCISKLIILMSKTDQELLLEQLKHYAEPNDLNQVIYHQRSTETDDRMQTLLNDADTLLSICNSVCEGTTEYELFIRCLSEQNIHSDSQFLKEHLEQMNVQEKNVTVVADGAYSGTENTVLAKEKNVNLITTSLTGREAPDIIADFEFNEEGTKVFRCPAGYQPKRCTYMAPSKQCQVSFQREQCAGCPYRDRCRPKIYKRVAKIITSKAAHDRTVIRRTMHSEEFKNYARLRNGGNCSIHPSE